MVAQVAVRVLVVMYHIMARLVVVLLTKETQVVLDLLPMLVWVAVAVAQKKQVVLVVLVKEVMATKKG
jgi:hypothetical protein